ncbi:MATE family efflux transporter [Sphingomicrobium aestuariivivum]|uniref:MATE family efflux transporter n=1 Tax=Sphingomicrobium aestuariivivum TaxID=1582356 RepID=UPI001FD6EC60|nr:MATE family efflux transporter [Sphingomicrobium aestuariivivum]MCJ8190608.1 MATE family efflux transporter [Sphingomicrobium aestuariivivum]
MSRSASLTAHPWRHEFQTTLKLAWPLILSNLTMASVQAIDTFFLGRYGTSELASAALALNLTFALNLVALGIITAASPMMATALGKAKGRVKDVRRSFRQSVWLAVSITIPIWAVLMNADTVIGWLGQEPRLAQDAQVFLWGYLWSTLLFLLFNTLRHFLAALERPGWVLMISACSIPINSFLDYALIFGEFGFPELGLFGAGLASTITWALLCAALITVVQLDRQFRRFSLFSRFWRPDWARYARMWKLGLPIGLAMGFEGGIFSAAAYLMGLVGEKALAAHAIALQIAALSFMVPWGIAQASTVRVGIMLGRGDRDGIARAGWTAWILGVGFMSFMAIFLFLFPAELIGVFLADTPENAEVLALGVSFLLIAAIFQIVDGAQVVGAGVLRGLHDTRVPMVYTFIGYWVIGLGAGAWLAFGAGWEGEGIWTGLAIGLAIVAVLMLQRWMRREALGLTDPARGAAD